MNIKSSSSAHVKIGDLLTTFLFKKYLYEGIWVNYKVEIARYIYIRCG